MKWRRLGEEEIFFDDSCLVTRLRRKPVVWQVDCIKDDGSTVSSILMKGPKGTPKTQLWRVLFGDQSKAFATKLRALRYCMTLEAPEAKEGPAL
jgi:hypothetical protein